MNVPIVWVVVPDVTLEEVEKCSIGLLHLAVAVGVSGGCARLVDAKQGAKVTENSAFEFRSLVAVDTVEDSMFGDPTVKKLEGHRPRFLTWECLGFDRLGKVFNHDKEEPVALPFTRKRAVQCRCRRVPRRVPICIGCSGAIGLAFGPFKLAHGVQVLQNVFTASRSSSVEELRFPFFVPLGG